MGAVRFGLLALLWGSSFLWIKLALRGFSPVQISFGRLLLGALVLLSVVLIRQLPWPRSRRVWGHLFVAALLGNAIPYTLFAVGEQTVGSNVAGILNATTPLFTVFAVAMTSRSSPGVRVVAGSLLGFLGVALVVDPFSVSASSFNGGALACLLAAVSYAASYVYMERYLTGSREFANVTLAGSQLAASAVLMTLALPVAGLSAPTWRLDAVVALLVLGALGTGAAYLLNYRLIADVGSARSSTVIYLLPLVAVALGWLVLREPVSPLAGAGAVLILFGIYLVRRGRVSPVSSAAVSAAPAVLPSAPAGPPAPAASAGPQSSDGSGRT